MSLRSPSTEDPHFLPIFRSGSCSVKGPKQYMEDEFICVDNICDHVNSTANNVPSGAFYGVRFFFLLLGESVLMSYVCLDGPSRLSFFAP